MKRPAEVTLRREEGEALLSRLERDALTAEDRRVLAKVLTVYFWLLFALREAKLSLKRLKVLVVGEQPKKRAPPESGGSTGGGGGGGGTRARTAEAPAGPSTRESAPAEGGKRQAGHGRQSAAVYREGQRVEGRQEELAVGERCPACGRGRLYGLPAGIEMRLDGNALLSAVRYELERLRCSACGAVFTAVLPEEAGTEQYSARARAVVALGRYDLGVPF